MYRLWIIRKSHIAHQWSRLELMSNPQNGRDEYDQMRSAIKRSPSCMVIIHSLRPLGQDAVQTV